MLIFKFCYFNNHRCTDLFKYISCWYSRAFEAALNLLLFKYISCWYSSAAIYAVKEHSKYLNTSHVDIQENAEIEKEDDELNLNTSHVDIQAGYKIYQTMKYHDLNTSHVDIQGKLSLI